MGGVWEWPSQDRGGSYHNGCLRDDMLSCMIVLDRSDRNNGYPQIVQRSHKVGRISHVPVSDKWDAAHPKRMACILGRHPLVHCELVPHEVLILPQPSCCTAPTRVPFTQPPLDLLVAYAVVSNRALVREEDRSYVPLDKVDYGVIKSAGLRLATAQDEHLAKAFVPKVLA